MNDVDAWSERYRSSSPLGRAWLLTETGIHAAATVLDRAIHYTADLVVHTQKAYRQGLDPNIEDARILEETTRSEPEPPPDAVS